MGPSSSRTVNGQLEPRCDAAGCSLDDAIRIPSDDESEYDDLDDSQSETSLLSIDELLHRFARKGDESGGVAGAEADKGFNVTSNTGDKTDRADPDNETSYPQQERDPEGSPAPCVPAIQRRLSRSPGTLRAGQDLPVPPSSALCEAGQSSFPGDTTRGKTTEEICRATPPGVKVQHLPRPDRPTEPSRPDDGTYGFTERMLAGAIGHEGSMRPPLTNSRVPSPASVCPASPATGPLRKASSPSPAIKGTSTSGATPHQARRSAHWKRDDEVRPPNSRPERKCKKVCSYRPDNDSESEEPRSSVNSREHGNRRGQLTRPAHGDRAQDILHHGSGPSNRQHTAMKAPGRGVFPARQRHTTHDRGRAGKAISAKFEEWPLENAVLKRVTEDAVVTFQLQFTWGPYAKHSLANRHARDDRYG
ncbi:hypothetical protein DL770_007775 [Monosporascus sp. CRB-9-2]|nr:hypothetical protein DL770_007775 [Monosporascus sp. CRB-9-2]